MVLVGSVVLLDDNVSVTNDCENSLHWKSRSDDESSSEMDVVWLVDACCLLIFSMVNIDKSPFLLDGVALARDTNTSAFSVLSSGNLENSVVLNVDEVVLLPLEVLEPISIGLPDLHV